uniref:Uncharacterized protein n=1 Tax=viral metagenome TaxID=1070528 RepID=A0A6M3L102_9ZZZZ
MPDTSQPPELDLSQYAVSNILSSGTSITHYGLVARNGSWYILEEDTTNGTYMYNTGTSSYTTAWTNRKTATYNYFYVEF